MSGVIIPRNFRLLDELEACEKGKLNMAVSLGLETYDDNTMTNWVATIFGPQGTMFDGRIYTLKLRCGKNYPDEPPSVRFQTQARMNCVSETGEVTRKLRVISEWQRSYTMETILLEIRKAMMSNENRKVKQPPETSVFFD